MSKHLWEPVPAAVVEAAWAARGRGLSLRAVAAELAIKDMLSPSGRPYLPGSIAAMLRYREHPAAPIVDDDPEVEIDEQPGADTVAASPAAELEPGADAVPTPVDIVDRTQQPLTELTPQTVDALPADPVVDEATVKPQWQPRRGAHGLIDFRSLMQRLCEVPYLQEAAMASVNLRVDEMGVLADRGDWRECVASWLTINT
jgi:hypothetical protein